MKILRLITVSIISIALLVTGIGAALADENEGATPTPTLTPEAAAHEVEYQGLVGTIQAIVGTVPAATGITLDTVARGAIEVTLNDETTYKIPNQNEATQEEVIIEGKRVAILATEADGAYTAMSVMLISDKATRCHVRHMTGVVTEVNAEAGTMVITTGNGKKAGITVDIAEGVEAPDEGSFIIASVRECPEGNPVCIGFRTVEQIQQRLQNHLAEVIANRVENRVEKDKNIESLTTSLTRLGERHQEVLNTALENTDNEAGREVIQNAIQNTSQSSTKGNSQDRGKGH